MSTSLRRGLALIVVVSMAQCSQLKAANGGELLDFVRDAHKASRDSIRTCSCKVEFKGALSNTGKIESCSGRYWYSPTVVRAKVSELGKELDYQWEDSKTVSVSHGSLNGKSEVVAGRWPDASRYIGRCDAWARAL